jgi:hypothetical protein
VLRREPSIDFQSALAAGLDAVPDPEVLSLAAAQDRIVVSHDESSMPAHFAEFLKTGNHSPGVLPGISMVPQGALVGRVIGSIVLIWIASDASEWVDRIVWLPI